MSTLLHLDSAAWGRKVNFTQYAAVAAELLHASRDAIEAITSFQELAFHAAGSAALPKASWLDFDAHPGDCACQIRPAGLHLLVCAFRSDPHKTKAKLQGTLDRLLEVATVAKETFHQLCTLNLNVAKIGAGLDRKSMILEDFCYAIGAGTWFDQICQPDLWLAASPSKSLRRTLVSQDDAAHLPTLANDSASSKGRTCPMHAACNDLDAKHDDASAASSPSTASTRSLSTHISPASSIKGGESSSSLATSTFPTDTITLKINTTEVKQPRVRFQLEDWNFVVRWIVICFSIGRYRQVSPNKKNDALIYRISISDALKRLDERDGALLQCKSAKGAHRCTHSKAQASVEAKATTEIEKLQSWTSHASADLVINLSQLSNSSGQQVGESFSIGPREVGCVPTFLTIQPLLLAWKQLDLPIFIVLKTITEQGYTIDSLKARSTRDMLIEAVSPQQAASADGAQGLSLPHAVFYSQRVCVSLSQGDPKLSNCRLVEEMELKDNVPASLLPRTSVGRGLDSDSEEFVRILSNGGLHDMLLAFFAQHCDFPFPKADSKTLRAWHLEQQEWVNYSMQHGCNYENATAMVPRHCFYATPFELIRICEEAVHSGSTLSVPGFTQAR
ncbi:cytochrome P450 CYP4/CYP19/CYP26 subfamilies [Moesziomyces antarcticus T-34]|uniref:Cytochrome P450 CYP4/CYP19/CYP26 subfamilies n=1 Tax=Pseudozyma antarctica (strain T-34) TaxID=1151754 RepID=M9LYI6_PSEA3|nr:cytochrome P450 CYP4/CYP19/CYP26 subfamilies [Moesziomyces antarcticus T-34]